MNGRIGALAALALLAACNPPGDDLADGRIVLPVELREISGMAVVDANTLACVQDEAGGVFFLDLRGFEPLRVAMFGPVGDYEAIAVVGDAFWVLRSDGALLRLARRGDGLAIAASFRMPSGCEYEGLCHDVRWRRLLVLPKGPITSKKRERRLRRVLAFDLDTETVAADPVLTIDLRQHQELGKLMGTELVQLPDSDELLVLAAAQHLVVRVGPDGGVRGQRSLSPDELPQAEAMACLPDGRLLIASEGVAGRALLLVVAVP